MQPLELGSGMSERGQLNKVFESQAEPFHSSAPQAGREQLHPRLSLPLASGTLHTPSPGVTLPPQMLPRPAGKVEDPPDNEVMTLLPRWPDHTGLPAAHRALLCRGRAQVWQGRQAVLPGRGRPGLRAGGQGPVGVLCARL